MQWAVCCWQKTITRVGDKYRCLVTNNDRWYNACIKNRIELPASDVRWEVAPVSMYHTDSQLSLNFVLLKTWGREVVWSWLCVWTLKTKGAVGVQTAPLATQRSRWAWVRLLLHWSWAEAWRAQRKGLQMSQGVGWACGATVEAIVGCCTLVSKQQLTWCACIIIHCWTRLYMGLINC